MTYSVFYYAPVLKTNSVYLTGKQDDKVMAYVGKTDTDTIIRMSFLSVFVSCWVVPFDSRVSHSKQEKR